MASPKTPAEEEEATPPPPPSATEQAAPPAFSFNFGDKPAGAFFTGLSGKKRGGCADCERIAAAATTASSVTAPVFRTLSERSQQ